MKKTSKQKYLPSPVRTGLKVKENHSNSYDFLLKKLCDSFSCRLKIEVILMKFNPTRYSSVVGEIWVMATFKVKYCYKIFDMPVVRQLCDVLLREAFVFYNIRCQNLAFDSDHVHMILELGLYSKIELAKKIRGYVGRQLFILLPWLKRSKFWGSGLWNPAYDIRNVNDMAVYLRYLDKQKYSSTHQKMLSAY